MRSTRSLSWIERALGFEPIAPPPFVFAVDEGELRFAAFTRTQHGIALEHEMAVTLPPETFSAGPLGGPLHAPLVLRDAITAILSRVETPVREASLLLPDAWLRLAFSEIDELSKKSALADQELRFKLKRLVPFRVEDLRVAAFQVTPFPNQEEKLRVLIGFAIEILLEQIESAFTACGVQVGRITNNTIALLAGIAPLLRPGELGALLAIHPDATSLAYVRDGEPLIYRFKSFSESPLDAMSVERDLRLTLSFVRRQFPEVPIVRAFLATGPGAEQPWLEWVGDELGAPLEPLVYHHFSLLRARPATSWLHLGALLGAATLEVA